MRSQEWRDTYTCGSSRGVQESDFGEAVLLQKELLKLEVIARKRRQKTWTSIYDKLTKESELVTVASFGWRA